MSKKYYLKAGVFGDYGWKRVSFFKWLWYRNEYVNKTEILTKP